MHSESVILTLRERGASFAVLTDVWLCYACDAAVQQLTMENDSTGFCNDALWKGCQLLYKAGQFMPRAKEALFKVKMQMNEAERQLSAQMRRLLGAGAARYNSTEVASASCLNLSGDDALTCVRVGKITMREEVQCVDEI